MPADVADNIGRCVVVVDDGVKLDCWKYTVLKAGNIAPPFEK